MNRDATVSYINRVLAFSYYAERLGHGVSAGVMEEVRLGTADEALLVAGAISRYHLDAVCLTASVVCGHVRRRGSIRSARRARQAKNEQAAAVAGLQLMRRELAGAIEAFVACPTLTATVGGRDELGCLVRELPWIDGLIADIEADEAWDGLSVAQRGG